MKSYPPIMLDLETLGVDPGSVIVSIGATRFSWKDGSTLDKFYINVDAKDSVDHGLVINKDTIEWWGKQSKEARQAWMVDAKPLKEALTAFSEWHGAGKQELWCNGMNFDFPLLQVAYSKVGMEVPWAYYLLNDMRTIVNVFNARDKYQQFRKDNAEAVYHNALDDCIEQAKFLSSLIGSAKG